MKKIYLALLAAALAIPIQTQAAEYKVGTVTKGWETLSASSTSGSPSATDARSMAVSNDRIYTIDAGTNKFWYTQGSNKWSPFTVPTNGGFNIAGDDAGHIVYVYSGSKWGTDFNSNDFKIGILSPNTVTNQTSVQNFAVNAGVISGRSDYFSVSGNLMSPASSGGAAYVYFVNNKNNKLQRLKRDGSGNLSVDKTATISTISPSNFAKVAPGHNGIYFPNDVLVSVGGQSEKANPEIVDFSGTTATVTSGTYGTHNLSGTILKHATDPNKVFYIYESCVTSGTTATATQFSIYNPRTKEKIDVPVHTKTYTSASNCNGNWLWVDARWHDDNTIYVYCYQMGIGAWRFTVPLVAIEPPAVPVATGEVLSLLDNNANIKWNVCENATSYSVERSDDLKTWTTIATGVTETSYTDADFKTGVNALRHYRVKSYNANENLISEPSEVVSLYIPWTPTLKIYNFDGYAKVEIEWETPKGTLSQDPRRPSSFDIYRNGVFYKNLTVTHNVDFNLPVGDYEYYVVSKYATTPTFYTGDGVFEGVSNSVSATVTERWAGNILYGLEELYNYQVTKAATSAFSDDNNTVGAMKYAYNQDQWRQGKLWRENDGSYWWYISNRDNSKNPTPLNDGKSNGNTTGVDNNTSVDMVGGVFRIKADAGGAQLMANSAQRMITYKAYGSVGMAMDEKGNIFVRERDNFPIDMTSGSGARFEAGDASDVAFREYFTNGIVFRRYYNADNTPYYKDYSYGVYYKNKYGTLYPAYSGSNGGSEEAGDYKIIPFNVGIMKDVMNNEPTDYYAATGDLLDGTGSVYFANHRTNHGFKADVTNGTVTNVMATEDVEGEATGTENFFFPILPNQKDAQGNLLRDDYVLQIRSNSYGNIGSDGKKKHAIYTSNSRVNNAGGTTAYFNGEMFLITPEAIQSKNTGDFFIAKAVAADGGKIEKPSDAVFSEATTVPIATWAQKDALAAAPDVENANSMWFGCVPYDTNADGTSNYNSLDTYMDIYLYVPGTRFAKYRLRPYVEILNPNTDIDVYIAYNDQKTEITSLDAKAAWTNVEYPGTDMELKLYNIEITVDGQEEPVMSFHVKPATAITDDEGNVVGHEHVVCDDNGNVITNSGIVINTEWRDASGNIVDKNTDGATEWCYVTLSDVDEDKNYVIKVGSVFGNAGEGAITNRRESDIVTDIDKTLYQPVDPSGTVYIDQEGYPFEMRDQWYPFPDGPKPNGEDGYWSYKWHVNYRVDIDFDKVYGYEGIYSETVPSDAKEPVSHYEIWYIPNDAAQEEGQPATPTQIREFTLLSAGGNKQITDGKIPGTYDFSGKTTAIPKGEGNNTEPSVLSFYVQPEAKLNDDGTPAVDASGKGTAANESDIPDGTYIIRAVWAAKNQKIMKIGQDETTAATIWGTTGVWNELVNLSAKDYISPNVTSDVTVAHTTGSIESIVIYNISGGVVAQIEGNKDCRQQVSVGDLASGVYFVSINGGKARRLIKK